MSGLRPGVTRRKTLSRLSSPKATEELLCSPLNSVEWTSVSRSWPASRWKVRPPYSGSVSGSVAAKASQVDLHRLAVVDRVVGVHLAEVLVVVRAEVGVVDPALLLGVVGERHLVALDRGVLAVGGGVLHGEDVDR